MTSDEEERLANILAGAKDEARKTTRLAIIRLFLNSPSGQVSKEQAERHGTEVYIGVMTAYLHSYREEALIRQRIEAGCTVLEWLGQPIVK